MMAGRASADGQRQRQADRHRPCCVVSQTGERIMSATSMAGRPVADDLSRAASPDPYPSRFADTDELPAMLPRREPVVHARYQQRWDGPLDEVALSHYERDGFLWFEGFFSRERVEPFFEELSALSCDSKLMNSD